ncbi:MAG TPA: hypothetical protein VHB21_11455, partial [Minicystis sp.]|nr:hypothetical protein [Minicystis sp.]
MAVHPAKRKGKVERNKWRVRLWVRNRQHEFWVPGTKKDAEAFEARKRVELEAAGGHVETRAAPTFSSFLSERYAPHAKLHLRGTTWRVRKSQLATLEGFFGDMKTTGIQTGDVERFKVARTRDGAKPRTVNNELAVLGAVRSHAKHMKVPIADFNIKRLPVVGRGRVTFWTEQQVEALYASLARESPDLLPIVVFIANTGCRKGEALAHEWERDGVNQVDVKRGIITIQPNEEWQPKDNEPREIPISDALLPWLDAPRRSKRWVFPSSAVDENGKAKRFACWPKLQFDRARKLAGHAEDCGLRVPKEKGGRLPGGAGKRKQPRGPATCTCGAVGLRGGPHTLRHTFATHFLREVPDIYLLAKVLG